MKLAIFLILVSILFCSCLTSEKINYSFNSRSVDDTVIQFLKNHEKIHQAPYQQTKWFALLRESDGGFELILSERFGDKEHPNNRLIRKTSRSLLIDNLRIPVLFESDILSSEMRKEKVGAINWGGYYFKIEKVEYQYKVVQTAILF